MKFKISSWEGKDGMLYHPTVKTYHNSFWGTFFGEYQDIDNIGTSNTKELALKRIDDYRKYIQAVKSFKCNSEEIVIK